MKPERTEVAHSILTDDLVALERHITGTLYAIWKLTGQNKKILKMD